MSHSIKKKTKLIKVFTNPQSSLIIFWIIKKFKKTDKLIFGKQHIRFQTPTKLKSINDTLQML